MYVAALRAFGLAALCLAFAFPAPAAPKGDLVDISKTPWGMPRAEVAKMLGVAAPEGDKPIILTGKLEDYEAGIVYSFRKDKLFAFTIQIAKGLDLAGAKKLVPRLEKDLRARYGDPVKKDLLCPGATTACTFSKWQKDGETFVLLRHETLKTGERVSIDYVSQAAQAEVDKEREEQAAQGKAGAKTPPPPVYSPALKGKDAEFEAAVQKRLKAQIKKLEKLAVFEMRDTDDKKLVRGALRIKEAVPAGQYKSMTKTVEDVVLVMVKEMIALGINPGEENIMVTCWAYMPEKGVTGKALVRQYGRAMYDPSIDNIVWKNAD